MSRYSDEEWEAIFGPPVITEEGLDALPPGPEGAERLRNLLDARFDEMRRSTQESLREDPIVNQEFMSHSGGPDPMLGAYGKRKARGFVRNEAGHRLNFLYDPSEVALSYDMAPHLNHPGNNDEKDTDARLFINGFHTSLHLLFDRSMEVASGAMAKAGGLSRSFAELGVLYDIGVLDAVIGSVDGAIMYTEMVTVRFGQFFHFSGHVQGCSVNYTLFDPDMVPLRAFVQLDLQRQSDPDTNRHYMDSNRRPYSETEWGGAGTGSGPPRVPAGGGASIPSNSRTPQPR